MSNKPLQNQEIRIAEHVAIACFCMGTAVVIALFLVPKTPGIVAISVCLIFALMCHPILVLASKTSRAKWVNVVGIGVLAVSCLAFAEYVWPDTEPISDLAIDQTVIQQPYAVGQGPNLNLDYFNYNVHTIKGKIFNGIHIYGGFPSIGDEHNSEEQLWGEFKQYVSTATDTTDVPFPPRVKTWASVVGTTNVLTQEQFQNLQEGNGRTYVIWVSAVFYKDGTGEHELDYCASTFSKEVVHLCQNHNGPAEPMEHKGFSYPHKWGIF
jgi:hypothetical protein